jgi:flagellar P-ring protein precursor FlgI
MIARTALALALVGAPSTLSAQVRVGDLTTRTGEVPVRLVGYGLVVGLDGSGDRSFGTATGSVQTVRSVVNLLRRFNIEVPPERLRLRNVAAVLVTAEVSPFLRPGGRFEVQVASMGDATSLRGGVLWMTPLVANPDEAPLGTAQGAMPVQVDDRGRWGNRGASSGRIVDGGLLELALPAVAPVTEPRLLLRTPDYPLAARVAAAVNAAFADSTVATVEDPGSVRLRAPGGATDNLPAFLASVDTIPVTVPTVSRIIIDARSGVVVAGGEVRVGPAVVSLKGITVRVGDAPPDTPTQGLVSVGPQATVRDIAAGLQAIGAAPGEVAAVFDGLRAAGAITAMVVVR